MAVFVDKLLIALGIDPRGAEQGLDRVNNSVDRTDAKLDELKHKAGDVGKVSDWNDFATLYGNDTAKAAALDALRHARAYFARALKG